MITIDYFRGCGGLANDYVIILEVIILAPQGEILGILCCKSIDFLKKIALMTQKVLKIFRLRRGYFFNIYFYSYIYFLISNIICSASMYMH